MPGYYYFDGKLVVRQKIFNHNLSAVDLSSLFLCSKSWRHCLFPQSKGSKIMKKRISKLLLTSLALASAMAVLSGCSKTSPKDQTGSTELSAAADSPSQAGTPADQSREMIFAASRDQAPGEKDSVYCTINLGVWQPLLTKDEEGQPAPALAETWSNNDDSTEWTFNLRKDVKFSNGVPFNAQTVLANFDRYKKGPFPSSFYGFQIDTVYPGLKEVIAVDDYTVKLSFSNPAPTLAYSMTNFGSSMFEPSCFADDGNFNGLPIGTGPYVMTENKPGEYCTIERNKSYYGEAPVLEKLRFRVIPDANTRYSALLSGEVDGLCDLGAITPSLAAELEGNEDFIVSVGESGITHYLNTNGKRFPFNDVRMRQGLSLLLDREEMNNEFYNGYNLPAGGFLNVTSPFYKKIDPVHDVEKGKALIKEVIGDQKITLDFLLSAGDASRYPHEEQAVYIQAILKEAGIDSNITVLEWGACKERMGAGDYDICLKVQGLPSADPYSLFKGYMYSKGSTNIAYGLGYSNPRVDEIIDKTANELDMDARKAAYNELQDISAIDFPNIPLLYSREVVACSAKVKNYVSTPYGLTGYTKVQWAE